MFENLDPNLLDALNQLLVAVLSAIAIAIGVGVRSAYKRYAPLLDDYLTGKLSEGQISILKELATTIVRNLEQNPAFKEFTGPERIKWAVTRLDQLANEKFGFDIDEDRLREYLEEAVQKMKAELKADEANS